MTTIKSKTSDKKNQAIIHGVDPNNIVLEHNELNIDDTGNTNEAVEKSHSFDEADHPQNLSDESLRSIDAVPELAELGVNGHQSTQGNYWNRSAVNFDYQIQALQSINAKWVRLDVISDALGTVTNTSPNYYWGRIFGTDRASINGNAASQGTKDNYGWFFRCQEANIKVLFILGVKAGGSNANNDQWTALYPTPADAYNAGYAQANGFVTNYINHITHLELGNELELFTKLLNGNGSGTHASHYYTDKLERAVQYVAGMEAGAKAAKPSIVTLFGIAGWLATYLLNQVLIAAPTINKISWHWYSEMQSKIKNGDLPGDGKTPASNTFTNIFDYIANRYPGKKVWFTEFGYRWTESVTWQQNETRQVNNYTSTVQDFLNADNCEVMFYHELLDMMSAGAFNQEKHYGLIGYPDYANTGAANPQYKLLFTELSS